ncbi:MAG: FprA family A-type flavoprotein [Nitrospirota bacterium]
MAIPVQITDDVYWVGAIDWNVRNFHGHTYNTRMGTTYNSYLIIDDKVTLIDTVYGPYADEMTDRIREIIEPEKIDYIIANHVEVDHSGALPHILKFAPNARIFGTEKCKEGLERHYYKTLNFQAVKTGDRLKLGKKSLTFIEAKMLHWPDSMFVYLDEAEILFPNDVFGQHYATSERFDDEVDNTILMDEAAKYYANIFWPFSSLMKKKIEETDNMNIRPVVIAPSHGIIWRKYPERIMDRYLSWADNETKPKVVIVYETMYGATAEMAGMIAEGIIDSGVSVKLYDITRSDRTEVIKEMLDAKGYIIGSSTHDNDMLPTIAGFLHFFKGLRPKKRIAVIFGSYGWGGGAEKEIASLLKKTGIDIFHTPLTVKYKPDEDDLKRSYRLGREFASIIEKGGE